MPIVSITFTRSMSQKMKIIVASGEQVAVLGQKDGELESMTEIAEDGLPINQSHMKVFSIQTGFGIMSGN